MNATKGTKSSRAPQIRRAIAAWLCGIVGYVSVYADGAPPWSSTQSGPAGVRLIGWGTVALPSGLVLGVGLAKDTSSSIGFLYHPDTNRWSATESVFGIFRLGEPLFVLPDGEALSFGVTRSDHRTKAMVFDPTINHWRDAGQLAADFDALGRQIVPLSGERFLMLSGRRTRVGWVYDAGKETWSATSEIPRETSELVLTMPLGGGNVFVIFGDTSMVQGWVGMVYDSTRDVWRVCQPSANTMRGTPTGVMKLPDGSILLIGFQQYPTPSFEPIIFHPDDLTWSSAGHLPPGDFLEARAPTLLPNGKVLALQKGAHFGKMRGILFDPARRTWTVDGAFPDGLLGAAVVGFRKDGSLWAIGYRSNVQSDELAFVPSQGVWKVVGPMPNGTVRWSPSGNPDGSMLLYLGPNNDAGSTIDDAAIFRP